MRIHINGFGNLIRNEISFSECLGFFRLVFQHLYPLILPDVTTSLYIPTSLFLLKVGPRVEVTTHRLYSFHRLTLAHFWSLLSGMSQSSCLPYPSVSVCFCAYSRVQFLSLSCSESKKLTVLLMRQDYVFFVICYFSQFAIEQAVFRASSLCKTVLQPFKFRSTLSHYSLLPNMITSLIIS